MSRPSSFWVLDSAEQQPLVVLANSSEGPWVDQCAPPRDRVPGPIAFWNIRAGSFGPVLVSVQLVLFRSDLIAVLREQSIAGFDSFAARIRSPQSPGEVTDYSVVEIKEARPVAVLASSTDIALISAVSENPGTVVVSEPLRRLLEQMKIE